MSFAITTAFVQTFGTNVQMLLQQEGSRLRGTVMNQACHGAGAAVAEQFGQVTAVKNQARHSDTPLISTPEDRRWIYPNDYEWADLIDNQDKLRLIIDPTSPYAMLGAYALGRAQDDEIIGAVFKVSATGQNGAVATPLPSAQIVPVNTGASGATGLNVAKLRAAHKLLLAAEVNVDVDPMFIIISAQQHDNLLNEVQATNLDYTNRPALVDGKIVSFMGFNFVHSERIPGAGASIYNDGSISTAGNYKVPCYAKSGMLFGMWDDIGSRIDVRPDKRYATQVYVKGTFGATRIEEKRVVEIDCV